MERVTVGDKEFELYIGQADLVARIKDMAAQLATDYADKDPLFIGILNGAFMFAAELFKHLSIAAEISFVKLASYKGTSSSGEVITAIGLDERLYGRHIITVEDILDTGKTLHAFLPEILHQHPASLKIACMLTKPDALQYAVTADYIGFAIPDKFVVGYGLDYDGYGRNLPGIYQLVT